MKQVVTFLLCAALILSGCQKTPAASGPADANPAPTAASANPDGGQAAAEPSEPDTRSEAEIAADVEAARLAVESLFPDVKFTKEEDRAAELVWSGQPDSLSVTDSAGLTWTLTLPPGSPAQPQTITMIPLASSPESAGRVKAGVQFQPDGLLFEEPAVLTVTGPGADRVMLLFADDQGKDGQFAPFTPVEGGVSAELLHFSTAFADSSMEIPEEAAKYKEIAYQAYEEYVDKARDLLKKQIKPPKPLKLDLECGAIDFDGITEAFRSYAGEELDYGLVMMAANMAATVNNDSALQQESLALMQQLAARGRAKLDLFLAFDNLKPETYIIAVTLMRQAGAFLFLFEGFRPEKAVEETMKANWENYISNIERAGEFAWLYLMDEIRNEHHYSLTQTAIITEDFLSSLQLRDGSGGESRRKELSDALTFTISFTGQTVQETDDGVATWGTSGEGKVRFPEDYDESRVPDEWVLAEDAEGKHTSFTTTDPSAASELITTSFTTRLVLTAGTPCFQDVRAGVTRLGANELTYASEIGPLTVPSFYNLINQLALEKYYQPLHQAVLVEMDEMVDGTSSQSEDMDGDHEQTEIQYNIQVEHTPQ
jgi:hypothetical protein